MNLRELLNERHELDQKIRAAILEQAEAISTVGVTVDVPAPKPTLNDAPPPPVPRRAPSGSGTTVSSEKVLDVLSKEGTMKTEELANKLEVPPAVALAVLKNLNLIGKVKREGAARGTTWTAAE